MAKAKRMENWEIEDIVDIEVSIAYDIPKKLKLSDEQRDVLETKRLIVERLAKRMMAGMVKGTMKYDKQELTQAEWQHFVFDETCDIANYVGLMLFNAADVEPMEYLEEPVEEFEEEEEELEEEEGDED